MKKFLNNEYFLLISRITVGTVFLMVSLAKVVHPGAFANEIGNYDLFPEIIVNFSAVVLPWIELICGMLLIAGVRLKANSLIISILLIFFILSVGSAMARGLNIDCGCYSNIKAEKVGWNKIFENLSMLLLTLNIYFSNNKKLTLEYFAIKEAN